MKTRSDFSSPAIPSLGADMRRFLNVFRRLLRRPTIKANGGKHYTFKLATGKYKTKWLPFSR